MEVMVEGPSHTDETVWNGRTDTNSWCFGSILQGKAGRFGSGKDTAGPDLDIERYFGSLKIDCSENRFR